MDGNLFQDLSIQLETRILRTHTAKNGKTKYCVFKLQIAETMYIRCVTFNPQSHRDNLVTAASLEDAVILKDAMYSPSQDDFTKQDATLDYRTKILPTTIESYDYCEEQVHFLNLSSLVGKKNGASVNICVKVISEETQKEINCSKHQNKAIADETGTGRLATWADASSAIQVGHSYKIFELVVKTWNDTKYLSTTHDTEFIPIDDLTIPESLAASSQLLATETVTATLDSITITKHHKCKNCGLLLDVEESAKLVKCTSCGTLQKKDAMYIFYRGSLSGTDTITSKAISPTITNEAICDFANKVSLKNAPFQDVSKISCEELQTILLLQDEITLSMDKKTNVVDCISLTYA